jgi:hypothetical protein
MVISRNMVSQLSTIQPFNGSNYVSWRDTIEIVLALWEIDFAHMTDTPKEPAKLVIHEGEIAEPFATCQWDFAPIRMAYDF